MHPLSRSKAPIFLTLLFGLLAVQNSFATIHPELFRNSIYFLEISVQQCYTGQYLNRAGKSGGLVELRWLVNKNGYGQSVQYVNDTVKNAEGLQCVFKMIEAYRFPKPEDGQVTEVSYTFGVMPKITRFAPIETPLKN